MNAYLIQEEESYVVIADSMADACRQAALMHCEELVGYRLEADGEEPPHAEIDEARQDFEDNWIQSCSLVGEVRKPGDLE